MDAVLGKTIIPLDDMLWRLVLAMAIGFVLGLDREMRGISVGLRTHMLVALSSAMTMLVALEIFGQFAAQGRSPPDPIRVIHGLAIAVGILCSGAIFIAKGSVHGLTTAANLWTTSALSVAVGAGMYKI